MKLYYSGTGSSYAQPECMLKDRAVLMLTFIDFVKKEKPEPDTRFRKILEKRQEKKK